MYSVKESDLNFEVIDLIQRLLAAVTNIHAVYDPVLNHLRMLPEPERMVLIADLENLQELVFNNQIDLTAAEQRALGLVKI